MTHKAEITIQANTVWYAHDTFAVVGMSNGSVGRIQPKLVPESKIITKNSSKLSMHNIGNLLLCSNNKISYLSTSLRLFKAIIFHLF